ncbi:MAG: glucose-1-phosphate thymidylyltransferase RfbA [Kiritimatiellae bacterium]|nr:glucose-1-phosphate thymidylyltransferase RfbA [Kiritimatiellia bacterium]
MSRKGIILAGGAGSRLHPLTKVVSKQLLPVYDKPMIFYPLSTLMLAGIREVLIISTHQDLPNFERLLGDGSDLGMKFSYKVQEVPNGLAQAFVLGREFIGDDDVCLVLGDNIFYGSELPKLLQTANASKEPVVFGYRVADPERYGVAECDDNGKVISLEEKPAKPKSNWAVVGLYFYPNDVVKYAVELKPSDRGEYEITDLNKIYLRENRLVLRRMSRGVAWLDTGTHQSLADATNFVRAIVERQGLQMSCIEEIAWRQGWIDNAKLHVLSNNYGKSSYGQYLRDLAEGKLV